MAEVVIPYNSVPVYDAWGIDTHWDLATWVAWHRGLVKKYGREKDKDGYPIADKIWLTAWGKQSSYSEPIMEIIQPSRFKSETDYLKQFPLIYQATPLKTATEKINPLDMPYKNAEKLKNAVEDTVSSVSTTAKILKYGIPIVLVVGAGLLIWYGVRKVQKA